MPGKKKKYNARFPAGRIKKIMQSDEEVGKVAQAVPVIISRTLELFVGSLLQKAMQITSAKNAKTLTPSHMKQCILSEQRFDFLKDLVKTVQDSSNGDEEMSGFSSSLLTGVPGRTAPPRRTSSCSSQIEEIYIKEEALIKDDIDAQEEAIIKVDSEEDDDNEEEDNPSSFAKCSNIHMNPSSHLKPSEGSRIVPSLKTETISPTCSNVQFSPNFYSESVPEERVISSVKTEDAPIKEEAVRCSAIRLNPNYYKGSDLRESNLKTKTELSSSCTNARFCPNFYSETLTESRTTDSSSLNLGPNFYVDSVPAKRLSNQTPPTAVPHLEHPRIAPLTMDENYDT